MYRHYRVNRMSSKARRIVGELFRLLHREPQCLPTEWRQQTDGPETAVTARVVADYIAGMTDRFALDEHARLFDRYAAP
jgi:dGTPase